MTEVSLADALDEAQFVKTMQYGEWSYVQVWYGGVQVSIFGIDSDGQWDELDVWSISDEKGRPVSKAIISNHMQQHFELMFEGFEAGEDEL